MQKNDLIGNYVKNNELNIEDVMNEYTPYIYTILKNKNSTLSKEDMEEIISDVFLAVWKNQKNLDTNKKITAYLTGITRNLYNKKIRNTSNTTNINNYKNVLFENDNLELKIESTEKEKMITLIVNNMKQEDENIFTLYYYHAKTTKEIATILGLKENKVRSRLFRIRKKIKKCLERKGYKYNG